MSRFVSELGLCPVRYTDYSGRYVSNSPYQVSDMDLYIYIYIYICYLLTYTYLLTGDALHGSNCYFSLAKRLLTYL